MRLKNRYLLSRNRYFSKYRQNKPALQILKKTCFGYNEPVSLLHLKHLSKCLRRSIYVWSNGKIIYSYGNCYGKPKLEVEYVKNLNSKVQIGHYMLKEKLEPIIQETKHINNCLFNVISAQSGVPPKLLRRRVQRRIQKRLLREKEAYILQQNSLSNDFLGGAQYRGKSFLDANLIIDRSQKGESHPDKREGHARGHASCVGAVGYKDSVENYSMVYRKTGFLSRFNQDCVAHLVFKTRNAQDSMEMLNAMGKAGYKEIISTRANELDTNPYKLPKAQNWVKGKRSGEPFAFRKLTTVIKHFYKKYNNPKENVFILTFFPNHNT